MYLKKNNKFLQYINRTLIDFLFFKKKKSFIKELKKIYK